MAAPMGRCASNRFSRFVCCRSKLQVQRILTKSYMTGSRNILKLHDRGIFQNVFPEERSPELLQLIGGKPQTFYCGFDPTAESLHIGNLLALIGLLHCHRGGHNIIALIGGATAQIGDPSGKTSDRERMEVDTVFKNTSSIESSLHRIFANHLKYFAKDCKNLTDIKILNNVDWYKDRNVVEFLSTVGRYFRLGSMLHKQSVQSRLNSEEGMSLTEFTYQVFQSYDWLYLLKKHNCKIQIGGNDQLGNMTAGQTLISRVTNEHVYGLTVPLVTSSTGDKLGKTAGNAVWLNPDKTSPFELYQFYINIPDADVERFLKLFTFYNEEEIKQIMNRHKINPGDRYAQKKLGENVVTLVHGEAGLQSAQRCTAVLFHSSTDELTRMTETELQTIFKNAPITKMYLEPGTTLLHTVMKAKCFNRDVDAVRIIKEGGCYVNFQRAQNPQAVLIPGEHILPSSTTVIRIGKKNFYLVKWLGAGLL